MRFIVLIPLLGAFACSAKQSSSPPSGGTPNYGPDYDPDQISVPFLVDDHYIPSGCMGDCVSNVTIDSDCPNRGSADAQGECHHFVFSPNTAVDAVGWAGVLWQTTEKNWGSLPGRSVLPGARSVQFYISGKAGGEALDILIGGMAPDDAGKSCSSGESCASGACERGGCTAPHHDTLNVVEPLVLTPGFVKVEIPFGTRDYGSEVLSGFGWTAKAPKDGASIEFYVDDLRWE